MAKLVILLVCGLLPAALSQCTVERNDPLIKKAVYDFATEITTRIARNKDNHFVASPLSIWSLLAVTSFGASGEILLTFERLLGFQSQGCFYVNKFKMVNLESSDITVTVGQNSTIFAAEELGIYEDFKRKAADAGVVKFVMFPMNDDYLDIPNFNSDHVGSTVTNFNLQSIIEEFDYLILNNAIYFKGLWQTPFPFQNTQLKPFYDDLGEQIGEVEMMKVLGNFSMSTINRIGATMLELPFGADGRYAMMVFLPEQGKTLSTFIERLMGVSVSTSYTVFGQDCVQTIWVEIPKFDISSDLDNLKELLSDMGLRPTEFLNMGQWEVFISEIKQKANVKVSEVGIGMEAHLTMGAIDSFGSGPSVFRADKPFLYMIVDTVTEVPLFTGAFSKPT